jgi:16S rRNA (cytosine967-C5)-methyltransferase
MAGMDLKPGVLVRLRAANVLLAITQDYQQLDEALDRYNEGLSRQDQALLQAVCYGVMRWYVELVFWLEKLSKRPFTELKPAVRILILIGLYQLKYMRIPAHAAIHATVDCAAPLKSVKAKGLVNAVLREFQRYLAADDRYRSALDKQPDSIRYSHPEWMLKRFEQDWPDDWRQFAEYNNQQAPMTLRVDTSRTGLEQYLSGLQSSDIKASRHPISPDALVLEEPVDVDSLPGFSQGLVSVQDAAAQLAVPLLVDDQPHHVLDACAAPGGKTAQLLQKARPASLVALDNSAVRLKRVAETLDRIGLPADIVCGDASNPSDWWDNRLFDRILLDAPCSASGVIRRHPDIKYLRSEKALIKIAKRQAKILDALWQLLKPGGMLLYVTCSVFRVENQDQVTAFLQRWPDAGLAEMPVDWGRGKIGRQILPGDENMDGFYFALLMKR